MSDKRKLVYIVTAGSYDDYRIDAVFTNKSDAQAFARDYDASERADVEEWPLYSSFAEAPVKSRVYWAWAKLDKTGKVTNRGGYNKSLEWLEPPLSTQARRESGRSRRLLVSGPTAELAEQALGDWIAEVQAMRQGALPEK